MILNVLVLKKDQDVIKEDRKRIWQYPEDIIGKIITVKYKEETNNKDGGISIQFPVFETVRFDKNEPSYN